MEIVQKKNSSEIVQKKQSECSQKKKKEIEDFLFSEILSSYWKLFRQVSPSFYQYWLSLMVSTRKVVKFK